MIITSRYLLMALLCTALQNAAHPQDAETHYRQGVELAMAGELEEAIGHFNRSIELQPDDHFALYNRGLALAMLGRHDEALPDYDQCIKLAPEYHRAYLNRGTSRKRLTDFEGALADYSAAVSLEPEDPDGYFNRGLVLELLGERDAACNDFQKAFDLGADGAASKIERCNGTDSYPVHPILWLTKTGSKEYGFSEKDPVKVGRGPDGGPANQHAYLNLLRDAQGRPVKYERQGSCCPHPSEYGIFGIAKLDRYEITYSDKNDTEQRAIVFMSFYDHEEPQILHGFGTIPRP